MKTPPKNDPPPRTNDVPELQRLIRKEDTAKLRGKELKAATKGAGLLGRFLGR